MSLGCGFLGLIEITIALLLSSQRIQGSPFFQDLFLKSPWTTEP
jgi:hypothetical protein